MKSKIKNKDFKYLLDKLNKEKVLLAARRDELRDIMDESEQLLMNVNTAYESLDNCIDILSEYV